MIAAVVLVGTVAAIALVIKKLVPWVMVDRNAWIKECQEQAEEHYAQPGWISSRTNHVGDN